MSVWRATAAAIVLSSLAFAGPAVAQDPQLPPGHPPVGAQAPQAPTAPPPPTPGQPPQAPQNQPPVGQPQQPPAVQPPQGQPPVGQPPQGQPPAGPSARGQALPPGHPPTGAPDPGQAPPPTTAEQRRLQEVLRPPALTRESASTEVPVGAIRVHVVGPEGQPIAGAAVDVGVLAQAGDRERHNAETDASGTALFTDLPTGTAQAYRVNVPFGGAVYGSTPFQLPTDRGYDVTVTRLPVTRNDQFVFFHLFRVVIEQRNERLHVIHQAQLTNAGTETYVFPAAGERVALPEGALAFQVQRVMTDQRIEEISGEDAYRIKGSMPPGTVQLAWAYDLPVSDDEVEIPVGVPLRFFGAQVIAEALPELRVDVGGMPAATRRDLQGQVCEDSVQSPGCAWVTTLRRAPTDPAISAFTVTVSGIPGPPPVRWFGVWLALAFVIGGSILAFVRSDGAPASERAHGRRKSELLDEARELERDLRAGEVGPEFHRKRRDAITRDLAVLLSLEQAEADAADPSFGASRTRELSGGIVGGFALGFFLGLVGLGVAYVGRFTTAAKRGAWYGFGVQAGLGLIALFVERLV